MDFIHILNLSAVTFIRVPVELPNFGDQRIALYEAYSPYGEIRQFNSYEDANNWRINECVDMYNWAQTNKRVIWV